MQPKTFTLTEGAKRALDLLACDNPKIYEQVYKEAVFADKEGNPAGNDILEQAKGGIEFIFSMDELEGIAIEVSLSGQQWYMRHNVIYHDDIPEAIKVKIENAEGLTLKEAGIFDSPLFEGLSLDGASDSGMGDYEIEISDLWSSHEWQLGKNGFQKRDSN